MLVCARFLDDRPARVTEAENQTAELTRVRGGVRQGLALMASRSMLMMFLFFTLTATATSGIMSFSVVANVMLHEVDKIMAAGVLTAHLTASAVGVLIGGWLADRIRRHNLVTSLAIVAMAAAILLLAYDGIAVIVMTGAMVLSGLFYGISSPSRDVLVKLATPSGSAGVTFGFTSTGISVGKRRKEKPRLAEIHDPAEQERADQIAHAYPCRGETKRDAGRPAGRRLLDQHVTRWTADSVKQPAEHHGPGHHEHRDPVIGQKQNSRRHGDNGE